MHMNNIKFEKNSFLEYYQITYIVMTKHTSYRGLFFFYKKYSSTPKTC